MPCRLSLLALALLLAAPALTACAGAPYIEPDGTLVRHYLGYVRVAIPPAAARSAVYDSDVTVFGVRAGGGLHEERGFSVGYARDRQLVVPLDCRVVVLVRNRAELEHAHRALSALVDTGAGCVALSPSLTSEAPR
jgi:hypothetical protein